MKGVLVIGITILFLGLVIQPSIATVQPEKIDVEPDVDDVEGLVAQLRVAVNEILQDYGHISVIRALCIMILDSTWFLGKIIICVFLAFTISFYIALCIYLPNVFYFLRAPLQYLGSLAFVLFLKADCLGLEYFYPFKFISSLLETNDITNLVNDCPCMQE